MDRIFKDRREAGRYLASKLKKYKGKKNAVVLGLPRGGVVVAHEVAQALGLPLDVFVVRKLGLPGYEELAMGAIASGGALVVDEELIQRAGVTREDVAHILREEFRELHRREELYRKDGLADVKGKTVLLVDDGLATGSTMMAAVSALKKLEAKILVVAVPVGAPETCAAFEKEVDETVCATAPDPFQAVGVWYEDFRPTTDEEVKELLDEKNSRIVHA